jgi:N-acetylglucosamine kinase-like BadF-type ATPase
MTSVYIAIDSGGNRTNVSLRVENPGEPPIRRGREIKEALSGYLSPSDYVPVLRDILAPLESAWRDLDLEGSDAYLFISAAGYAAWSRELFLGLIKEVIPSAFGGSVRAVGVANDSVTLLLGHASDGVVIAGTGSNVLVRAADGDIHQAGGNEWVASDTGAGFWIGLEAIRVVARALESGKDTTLLQRFCSEYHVSPDVDGEVIACFRKLAIADHDMKAEIAKFATSVCAAAQKGDEEAQRIVKSQAEDLAMSLATALRRRLAADDITDGLSIVLSGSVIGNPFYRSAFQSMVGLTLFSGTSTEDVIAWHEVGDGMEAAFALSKQLESNPSSLLDIGGQYMPLVLTY